MAFLAKEIVKGCDFKVTNIEKIGKIEAIALFITIISNNIIINISTIVLNYTSTGSWLNILYLTVLCLLFVLLICNFFKPFINADILDVSYFLGGKVLYYIISILYIIFFLFFSALCTRYFANSLNIIYFNSTPLVALVLLLLIPAAIASRVGLKAVSGSNIIFVPITIITFFIFFFASIRFYSWQNLFPALGYGLKETFLTNITNIFAFNVVAYLYFLKPFLKNEDDYKKISIFAVVICGLYLFISIIALLMTFSFITLTDETLSVYLITRLISFGRFFQRIDAFFVFTWILVILSFLSFNLFIVAHIIKKTTKLQSHTELVFPSCALLFSFSLFFKDMTIVKSITANTYKIYTVILVYIISFFILLFAYIKKNKGANK